MKRKLYLNNKPSCLSLLPGRVLAGACIKHPVFRVESPGMSGYNPQGYYVELEFQ